MDPQSLELQVWPQCNVEKIEEPQRPGGDQVLPLYYNALSPRMSFANKLYHLWQQAVSALTVVFALFMSATYTKGIGNIAGNSEVPFARYAAFSNVTAGSQDAVQSASSASSSTTSWEIIGVIGLVGTIVLTLAHNECLHWRNRKATKDENKEKEVKKEKRRIQKEKKRREEKETESREADRRNERLIGSLRKYASVVAPHRHQHHNLYLSAENRSDLSCHKMEHAGEVHDL